MSKIATPPVASPTGHIKVPHDKIAMRAYDKWVRCGAQRHARSGLAGGRARIASRIRPVRSDCSTLGSRESDQRFLPAPAWFFWRGLFLPVIFGDLKGMIAFAPELLCRVESRLSRLDPRWKLTALTVAAIAVALIQTVVCASVALLAALSLVPPSGLTFPALLRRLYGVIALVLFFAVWLPFFCLPMGEARGSSAPCRSRVVARSSAVPICLKTTAILTLVIVLLATAPANVYMCAASHMRVPAPILHVSMLTYRYLFVLVGEFDSLRVAVRLRLTEIECPCIAIGLSDIWREPCWCEVPTCAERVALRHAMSGI